MPAEPGKYELTLTLTNLATRQAFTQTRTILVPGQEAGIGISQLFFANAKPPERSEAAQDPFSFSGVRLRPVGADHFTVFQGEPLHAIFQVWAPAGSPAALHGKSVEVHYLIGRLDGRSRVEEDQLLDRGSFSSEGNLLVGKDLRTDTLSPGSYRLVVRVTDAATSATGYQSLSFEVQSTSHPEPALWTLDVPPAGQGK